MQWRASGGLLVGLFSGILAELIWEDIMQMCPCNMSIIKGNCYVFRQIVEAINRFLEV